ncbi:hypothetical protein PO124_22645 [Bacillus licheniformis]|nr:hypothetical protein [Bacillus licheniformis]
METHQELTRKPEIETFMIPHGPVYDRLKRLGIEADELILSERLRQAVQKKLPQGLIVWITADT